jgi:hypothetical protein
MSFYVLMVVRMRFFWVLTPLKIYSTEDGDSIFFQNTGVDL